MTANPPPRAEHPLPGTLEPLAAELAVYYRELPRLLDEGGSGKYFVAKGDADHGTWDTFHDAIQFGYAVFPDGRFLAQLIDERFLATLAPYFPAPTEPAEPEAA